MKSAVCEVGPISSLRMFHLPQGLPDDVIARFNRDAAPSLEALSRSEISGWVTHRHLLDRNIEEETVDFGGYLRLNLMKGERKIPSALLRAECRIEELAEMKAKSLSFLNRSDKAKIKKEVVDRMLPTMPPTLTGISLVCCKTDKMAYASALNEKQLDALTIRFEKTTGVRLIPVTPATVAMERCRVNFRDVTPTSFSPECNPDDVSDSVGQDFLTWLWFFSEHRGGVASLGHLGKFGVIVEGPLLFVMEGDGTHEALLRKGMPLKSAEAKTALLAGKKLRQVKVMLARGEEIFSAQVDADEFVFRSLKVPRTETIDPLSRFQEQMMALETFRDAFFMLYELFLRERCDQASWIKSLAEVYEWINGRESRR